MSGHSKWSTIKHKKARTDAKRGKIFSKIVKELIVAARMGGSDPSGNPRLRTAIDKAKSVNLPGENMERAIKKGAGELDGVAYEEGTYEGYGSGGVAVIVEYMTDNKNRTASDVRHAFTKHAGSLGTNGSVSWIFEQKGFFVFSMDSVAEDTLMEAAIEAGADDVVTNAEDKIYEVYTDPGEFHNVKTAFDEAGLIYEQGELTMIPKNEVKVEGRTAVKVMKLLEDLEDLDDVQNVYANFDISAEEMERIA
ncbi:MAG: YebC/PmpR family DNA-binding transcriptional regulator [Thermodesulfobacteriota bacterium]